MKKTPFGRILRALYHYLLFFLTVAFLVSCSTGVFLSVFSHDIGLTLTEENLGHAAKLTFLNVLLLSVLFTAIDVLRRKLTTERAAKQISDAAAQIVRGNFNVQIAQSARVAADESYAQIIDCFNTMAHELQSVETLRTDFVANVSHEMKTPLAAMQNYAALLQTPQLSEEKRLEYAAGAGDVARRMADLVTNILKLSRLENQTIYPKLTEFDLGEQICECLLQYETVWEREEIELETDLADAIKVRADAELLQLVWNNLFSNAFKFTPRGGRVRVTLTADETFATVKVSDTGCGMDAEVGAHIFEKFYQGDTSHAAQGNGLGLALVRRVVDILKGEIRVESTVGVGSTFTVKIRRSRTATENA